MHKTDPDSQMMRTQGQPTVQGYNAQTVVTRGQLIVAAEIAVESPNFGHLEPASHAALRELENAGVTERPETVLADAGYWHTRHMKNLVRDGIQVLVPARGRAMRRRPAGMGQGPYAFMRRVLASEAGHKLYKHRKATGRADVRPEQQVQPRLPPIPATRQTARRARSGGCKNDR